MSKRQRIKVRVGATRFSKANPVMYPSQARYAEAINAQMASVTKELNSIIDQFEDMTPEIMLEALEPTFEKSKRYCPKDTEELVASAYLEITEFRGKPRVEMGYAKHGHPFYAAYVHEIPTYEHDPPTRYKFLEAALKEDADRYARELARLMWESWFA